MNGGFTLLVKQPFVKYNISIDNESESFYNFKIFRETHKRISYKIREFSQNVELLWNMKFFIKYNTFITENFP